MRYDVVQTGDLISGIFRTFIRSTCLTAENFYKKFVLTRVDLLFLRFINAVLIKNETKPTEVNLAKCKMSIFFKLCIIVYHVKV